MENFRDEPPFAAPASVRHQMRFEGSGGEYFRIWIVNLALTIVTLGIFSAWAKVRNKRYFYGNTFIADHNFDYHGQPLRILVGRLIALALLLGYYLTLVMAPRAVLLWVLLFVVAAPWLIQSSFRFNARNTSYRNIRFDFHGTYWGALKAFLLWPLLAGLTLFTTLPLAHRARDYYRINNHSFGGKSFEAEIPGGKLYLIYLLAFVLFVAGLILMGVLFFNSGIDLASLGPGADGRPRPPAPATVGIFFLIGIVYIVTLLFIAAFVGTLTFNLAVSSTRLGGTVAFESTLSPFVMCWIVFTNLILTVITLGFFSPWATMRLMRYRADHIALTGPQSADGFVAGAAAPGNAIGEEVAGFFDFDFGL